MINRIRLYFFIPLLSCSSLFCILFVAVSRNRETFFQACFYFFFGLASSCAFLFRPVPTPVCLPT
ncbi:hypothetical protein F5B21DRAFT_292837 [Xylaria acuta]|nr:hypothetical protein F5B21DRAFT_292837 [Xylaria acuta]